ncbi:MAG: MFS transporter, partial [Pseudomonadota bacterium]
MIETGQPLVSNWKLITHPRVITLLFLGFSAGLPLLLIFSSLSLWLREAGTERAAVTYFSWAALGYSFKFIWAPLIDQLPLPVLARRLGRRRSWMLVAQSGIVLSILAMAAIDPKAGESALVWMAFAAVALGFSSATQDIVIDAYRIESAEVDLQAMMSASYIAGYRIGMLVAGAGSLYLADWFGSSSDVYRYEAWAMTYSAMALMMGVGIATTLLISEPAVTRPKEALQSSQDYARFLLLFAIAVGGFISIFYFSGDFVDAVRLSLGELFANHFLSAFLVELLRLALALTVAWLLALLLVRIGVVEYRTFEHTYLMPIRDFFRRYGWSLAWLLLALIGTYRISDIVLGVISNVF